MSALCEICGHYRRVLVDLRGLSPVDAGDLYPDMVTAIASNALIDPVKEMGHARLGTLRPRQAKPKAQQLPLFEAVS